MTRIAIIGAGFSGLSAAHLLKGCAEITLFEKARGVSGRMATRRCGPYRFDHGAQYFTAKTKLFQNFIEPFIEQEIIKQWDANCFIFKGGEIIEKNIWSKEEPRYVGLPGMSQVGKFLAKDLNININTHIVNIKQLDKWQLIDAQGQVYSGFDWVICSTPSPQAVQLLPKSFSYYKSIDAIKMKACFSLMLGFKKKLPLLFEAAYCTESDLSWIAVNSHKTRKLGCFELVVHSSEEYAESHINEDPKNVMQHLIKEASRVIGFDLSTSDHQNIHIWRYANNANKKAGSNVFLDAENKLAACGDWCLGGRVEGAFLAAYDLAFEIKKDFL